MKRPFLLMIFMLISMLAFSQASKDAKIKGCEKQATPFMNKIDVNHVYSYIAHISYIDCLIDEFPSYKQDYINSQIKPNITSLKSFGSLNDMPSDSRALLSKYWNL
jgi:hypothetical protein